MNIVTHIVMWAWIPLILRLFIVMKELGRVVERKSINDEIKKIDSWSKVSNAKTAKQNDEWIQNASSIIQDNSHVSNVKCFGGQGVLGLWVSNDSTRQAVIIAFVASWLFLPVARYNIPVLPDYTKMSATCIGVLLASLYLDSKRLSYFTLSLIDAPMLLWLISPFISSLTNGLGLWDALAALFQQIVSWGMPYFIGRVYINDIRGLHDLARCIFYGGLIYIPLCLIESRISPQLHRMVYGFMAHYDFSQTYRMGGWRPMVFMNHGLMVGVWMMSVTLNGYWMYRNGALDDVKNKLRLSFVMPILYFTMIWIRAFGAVMLLAIGLGLLFFSVKTKLRIGLAAFLLLPPIYMFSGVFNVPLGQIVVDGVASINAERASSLAFRVDNEHILVEKAMQQPIFGWGGWGRARVYNHLGEDISVTDSLWIIVLGNYGAFGLLCMCLVFFMPVFLFMIRFKSLSWAQRDYAPIASLSIMLALYTVDNLINAMENPIFIFVAGALSGTMTNTNHNNTKTAPNINTVSKSSHKIVSNKHKSYKPRFL